jgi:hypothetical protein
MPPGAMADPSHDFSMTAVDFLSNYVGDSPLRWGHRFSRTGVLGVETGYPNRAGLVRLRRRIVDRMSNIADGSLDF